MKYLLLFLVACGGSKTQPVGPGSGSGSAVEPKDTRTEIEKRRDAACLLVGEKITQCQVDDAKAQLAAGEVSQKDFDDATTPTALKQFTDLWMKKCMVPMTSFQVRVLEVCHKEETQCAPFYNCLDHINDKPKDPPAK